VSTVPSLPVTEKPGDRIGRYKLLQKLGEGGCGIVYMAEQEEPVKRRVALKVIKLGMDTREVIARFEAERQALALMDHANIAKVLDGGATSTGRPFFVMELVHGIPITRYCDDNRLDTTKRLELFILVCHAIQHAHQKGIIHRDIKPSNILVADHDGTPVPKVIDFGIAKATAGQTLTNKTLFTAFEQFIGTPAYMSPEQAKLSGLDIDTRSDIYSLGVLLYELLTGKTPFDAKRLIQSGLDEIRRIIREEDPPRPSTRLSTLAAEEQTAVARQRQTDPPKLAGLSGPVQLLNPKPHEQTKTPARPNSSVTWPTTTRMARAWCWRKWTGRTTTWVAYVNSFDKRRPIQSADSNGIIGSAKPTWI
jgi:serine/threonine protein kinase